MSSTIAELRAANVDLVPARPDYGETSQAFVGGYTLYGHVLTDNGEHNTRNVVTLALLTSLLLSAAHR